MTEGMGRLAAEYGVASSSSPCGTCYLTADTLGSTRLMTDQSGAAVARYDYLPFGKEIPASSSSGRAGVLCGSASCYDQSSAVNQKFTAKERDAETGLDYFGARYFSSAQGRFIIPDWSAAPQAVPYADYQFPQSLNLYTYLRNNPIVTRDEDGHCELLCFALIAGISYAVINAPVWYYEFKAHTITAGVKLSNSYALANQIPTACGGRSNCDITIESADRAKRDAISETIKAAEAGSNAPGTLTGGPLPTSLTDLAVSGAQSALTDTIESKSEEDPKEKDEEDRTVKEQQRQRDEEIKRQLELKRWEEWWRLHNRDASGFRQGSED